MFLFVLFVPFVANFLPSPLVNIHSRLRRLISYAPPALIHFDLLSLVNPECADTLVQVRSFNSEDACGPGHIPVRLFERF